MIIVCDVDGTLSNHDHRIGLVTGPKKDYEAYYSKMYLDVPFPEAQRVLKSFTLNPALGFWLLTGRPERYRAATEAWLREHFSFLTRYHLFMRPDGDYTKASIFKERVLQSKLIAEELEPIFIDDDLRNAEMYSRYGIFLKAPECWEVIR